MPGFSIPACGHTLPPPFHPCHFPAPPQSGIKMAGLHSQCQSKSSGKGKAGVQHKPLRYIKLYTCGLSLRAIIPAVFTRHISGFMPGFFILYLRHALRFLSAARNSPVPLRRARSCGASLPLQSKSQAGQGQKYSINHCVTLSCTLAGYRFGR